MIFPILSTLTKNVKINSMQFLLSLEEYWLHCESFYQIPLTWWNIDFGGRCVLLQLRGVERAAEDAERRGEHTLDKMTKLIWYCCTNIKFSVCFTHCSASSTKLVTPLSCSSTPLTKVNFRLGDGWILNPPTPLLHITLQQKRLNRRAKHTIGFKFCAEAEHWKLLLSAECFCFQFHLLPE